MGQDGEGEVDEDEEGGEQRGHGMDGSEGVNVSTSLPSTDLLLATASQDHTIRLWRMKWRKGREGGGGGVGSVGGGGEDNPTSMSPPSVTSLGSRGCVVQLGSSRCSIRLESLLEGHEDWVMAVQFKPTLTPSSTPSLLSCGVDAAVIVWSAPTVSGGVWRLLHRLGDLRHGALSGLFGARWGPGGHHIIAHGSTHTITHNNNDTDTDTDTTFHTSTHT